MKVPLKFIRIFVLKDILNHIYMIKIFKAIKIVAIFLTKINVINL